MRHAYHRRVPPTPNANLAARSPASPARASVAPRLLRLPALDAIAPMDVAEAFRDLPGLALLESARPGRTGRWSYLTADPVAVLDAPAEGPDPFAEARALLARLDGAPAAAVGTLAGARSLRRPSPAALSAISPTTLAAASSGSHRPRWWTSTCRCSDWPSTTGPSPGTAVRARRGWRGEQSMAGARRPSAAPATFSPGSRPSLAASCLGRVARPSRAASGSALGAAGTADAPVAFTSGTTRARWVAGVEAVRASIGRGEIYQANLTRRLAAPFSGDPWPLFRHLRTGDPALFAGYLDLGPSPATGTQRALLSASPEPFLSVDGEGNVATDPIKGTRPRGRSRDEDRSLARELLASRKDHAENVMIVDVLRNDLGRVCEPGSVRVPRLLRLERTAAVQHLVTTVTGRLRPDADAFDLLAASFPGGSITGAPKIRAMEIIEGLEPVRRGPYCGAMVWLGPDGRLGSSILIRTFVADGERLTLHVGGGITWRSDPVEEWDETVAKARGPLSSIGATEVET